MKKLLTATLSLCLTVSWSIHGFHTIRNIPVPPGCRRIAQPPGTFSSWISLLPLKNNQTILSWKGDIIKRSFYRTWAVVRMPLLFHQDLEQCADFCMRLRAEYHRSSGRLSDLFLYAYDGKKRYFSRSGKSLREFLRLRMIYSNSWSIKQGGMPVTDRSVRPGDMFIQNNTGKIGHASMVLDICRNGEGQRFFLIGYGFMPAQEFHIERARARYGPKGWFTLQGIRRYLSDFFGEYGSPVIRRF